MPYIMGMSLEAYRVYYEDIKLTHRAKRTVILRRLMRQFPNMYADYLFRIASDMAVEEMKMEGLL